MTRKIVRARVILTAVLSGMGADRAVLPAAPSVVVASCSRKRSERISKLQFGNRDVQTTQNVTAEI